MHRACLLVSADRTKNRSPFSHPFHRTAAYKMRKERPRKLGKGCEMPGIDLSTISTMMARCWAIISKASAPSPADRSRPSPVSSEPVDTNKCSALHSPSWTRTSVRIRANGVHDGLSQDPSQPPYGEQLRRHPHRHRGGEPPDRPGAEIRTSLSRLRRPTGLRRGLLTVSNLRALLLFLTQD